jgi:hypothetical protein
MNACEYLAMVGFDTLIETRTPADNEDDPASIEAARMADHAIAREKILAHKATPLAGRDGAKWIGEINWPDRVPGLKTWTGKMTLPQLIRRLQDLLRESDEPDLFLLSVPAIGASGIDALSCPTAIDAGFSVSRLEMPVFQRPALELLAILGLQQLPLISFAPRVCGFLHAGQVWQLLLHARDGGYYYRFGNLVPCETLEVIS